MIFLHRFYHLKGLASLGFAPPNLLFYSCNQFCTLFQCCFRLIREFLVFLETTRKSHQSHQNVKRMAIVRNHWSIELGEFSLFSSRNPLVIQDGHLNFNKHFIHLNHTKLRNATTAGQPHTYPPTRILLQLVKGPAHSSQLVLQIWNTPLGVGRCNLETWKNHMKIFEKKKHVPFIAAIPAIPGGLFRSVSNRCFRHLLTRPIRRKRGKNPTTQQRPQPSLRHVKHLLQGASGAIFGTSRTLTDRRISTPYGRK